MHTTKYQYFFPQSNQIRIGTLQIADNEQSKKNYRNTKST